MYIIAKISRLLFVGVTLVGGKIFVIGGFVDAELMDRGTSSVDSYSLETGINHWNILMSLLE